MYTNFDPEFSSNLISRHTTFLSDIPSAAQIVYWRSDAGDTPVQQTNIYYNQMTDVYNISRYIQSNTLLNINYDLHFLNRIFAQMLQSTEKAMLQKQVMLEKQVVLLKENNTVCLERTQTKALFAQAIMQVAGQIPLPIGRAHRKATSVAKIPVKPFERISHAFSREVVTHMLQERSHHLQQLLSQQPEGNALPTPAQVVYRSEQSSALSQEEQQTLLTQLETNTKTNMTERVIRQITKDQQTLAQIVLENHQHLTEQRLRQNLLQTQIQNQSQAQTVLENHQQVTEQRLQQNLLRTQTVLENHQQLTEQRLQQNLLQTQIQNQSQAQTVLQNHQQLTEQRLQQNLLQIQNQSQAQTVLENHQQVTEQRLQQNLLQTQIQSQAQTILQNNQQLTEQRLQQNLLQTLIQTQAQTGIEQQTELAQQIAQKLQFTPTETVYMRQEQAEETSALEPQQLQPSTTVQRKLAMQQKILQQAIAMQRERQTAFESSLAHLKKEGAMQTSRQSAQVLQTSTILHETRKLQEQISTEMQPFIIKESTRKETSLSKTEIQQTQLKSVATEYAPPPILHTDTITQHLPPLDAVQQILQPIVAQPPITAIQPPHTAQVEPVQLIAQQQTTQLAETQTSPQEQPPMQTDTPAPMQHRQQENVQMALRQIQQQQTQIFTQQLFRHEQMFHTLSTQQSGIGQVQGVFPVQMLPFSQQQPSQQSSEMHERTVESTPRLLRQEAPQKVQSAQQSSGIDDIVTIQRRKTITQEQHETQTQNIAINKPNINVGKPETILPTAAATTFSSEEINRLTDRVYKAIESKLRSERIRRGTI